MNTQTRKEEARRTLATVLALTLLCAAVLFFLKTSAPTEAELKVMAHAQAQGISAQQYPDSLIGLLEQNEEAEDFVLNYPFREEEPRIDLKEFAPSQGVPLFIQWDERWGYMEYGSGMVALNGCGPMCLAMAGYYVTGDSRFSPDRIVEFARDNDYYSEGNGSKWTLISVGGPALGLEVTELPLVEPKIAAYLRSGSPVIAVMGPGDFTATGHFIVLTGYEDGKFTVNDPNSYVNSQKQWGYEEIRTQFRNLWAIQAGSDA